MKHKGKLPPAVVGEVKHVINNALALIFLANEGTSEPEELTRKGAEAIRDYVAGLADKEDWNSNPFEEEAS